MRIQRTPGSKIKASMRTRVQHIRGIQSVVCKPIVVKVEYNPDEDYALKEFTKRIKAI
jgi:hypothetical protein